MRPYTAGQPSPPERIPTDTVIPLNNRDDTVQNRSISVEFTLCFDEVLSPGKLADALWRLLERPGWEKLGARLRMNANGRLEYHVPAQYTKERPPFNFTQNDYEMDLGENSIGAEFPRAIFPRGTDTQEVQVFDVLGALRGLTQAEYSTEVLDDWIYTDKAQLGLHVVSFHDATLVTITWLHTLLDAMGRQALLKAWQAVLDGRDDDVPEFWGYDFDPLATLGVTGGNDTEPEVESGLEEEASEVPAMTQTAKAPTQDGRMLYIPASYMSRLRKDAIASLAYAKPAELTMNVSDPDNASPFLSDGDILCAWLTRLLVASNPTLHSSPSRPVIVVNVLGMRDVLSKAEKDYEALIPKGAAYVHNCTMGVPSMFSVADLKDKPLGHVAARVRKSLIAQSTRENVEEVQRGFLRDEKAKRAGKKANATPGSYDSAPAVIVFTNWTKGKFFETDFSAAITGDRIDVQEDKPISSKGKPSYIHVHGTDKREFTTTGLGNCVGRDDEGNYWLGAIMNQDYVPAFLDALQEVH